ncbi:hypothetical protein F3N42_06150 [Marinihelvus fidelis]|uniref:D-serine dehydratase-like domain-containing protein n=1 Tax=Marinihelvus fidelis TaxID=2613842 RepID=A0A5N0THK2_9GAMM|nr:alanine racemase [Marinihelvus fidelis]KAA9132789.1 hypothetical protein F3N42_06150 [Marinihelvus fidelis]
MIDSPTLLLDRDRALRNLHRMQDRAQAAGVGFRPHFKTHQSRAVGEWYREAGIDRITVSSIAMAEYFADAGWDDILVAFPLNPLALPRYQALGSRVRLATLVDNPAALAVIADGPEPTMDLYVDIDAGYGRTGVPADQADRVGALIDTIDAMSGLTFRGFYCHPGDTYHHADADERGAIHTRATDGLQALKQRFAAHTPRVLMGDTPGCSTADGFPGVDEITPGNFIFYDLVQASLGACDEDDIAIAMACPVVGHYPDRGEIVIHGGGVHFAKDVLEVDGRHVFGKLAERDGDGWRISRQALYLDSISQEHGIIRVPAERLNEFRVGDVVIVLPVHSCMTADAMGGYVDLNGVAIDHF